jgi:hypothetical protein
LATNPKTHAENDKAALALAFFRSLSEIREKWKAITGYRKPIPTKVQKFTHLFI